MKLSREWKKRLEIWIEKIQKDFYILIGQVECKGFTTYEMLAPEEALKCDFKPMPVGTTWGEKWEYGWFKTEIILPDVAKGNRIIFSPDVGGEMLVWVNGKLAGSKDLEHNYVTLTRCAEGGEHYDILIESYAGHGARLENGGPYYPDDVPVPEPPKHQVKVNHAVIAIWNEHAYQAGLDAYTLDKLLSVLDDNSLRAQKVFDALKEFTYIVDFELPLEKRIENYVKVRSVLKPLLECVNGSTMPEFTVFGQSHLDLAWKWTYSETKRKCARTLSSQLALMDEYPEYRFMVCQVPILENIKKYYPNLYTRINEKIENGQMMLEGGVYVENDTNIPNGESLIRQFVHGKQWYQNEYGYESKMAWLPDTFGFTAALPQIMSGCDVDYFATQKLLRSHPETDPFPYNIFLWEGIDGTSTLSHMLMENNSAIDPEVLVNRWNEDRNQKENIETFMFPYGYGDGGGGPTRDIYELAKRVENLEGAPKTILRSPIDFFEDVKSRKLPVEKYVGELYLQWHRGTYTSVAALKKGNRKAEIALHDLEIWSTIGKHYSDANYPKNKITLLWKKLLFTQFHDILAGTSITRVNEEAMDDLDAIQKDAKALEKNILGNLNEDGTGNHLTIYNTLSWERQELIALPQGFNYACDLNGNELLAQEIDGKTFVSVKIPSMGYTTITLDKKDKAVNQFDGSFAYISEGLTYLENKFLRLAFNDLGQLEEIYDKESRTQLATNLCNNFKMYKDVNTEYDAWEIGTMYKSMPVKLDEPADVKILFGDKSKGLCAGIVIDRKINNSSLKQIVTLDKDSRRVDFKTQINWNEMHKLLKVEFPVDINTNEGISEIQFGYVKRPTHRSRQYDKDRFEVPQHKYSVLAEAGRGVAILNDSKYGVSFDGSSINLTLLKAPVIPDMYADKGMHSFTYSLYVYNGTFPDSGVVQNGYELNYLVKTAIGNGGYKSFFTLESTDNTSSKFIYDNIIIETVKEAEDESEDIIIRLYESQNTSAKCILHSDFNIESASSTNMLESVKEKLDVSNNSINLCFRPFEIKTIRLKVTTKEVR